MAGDYHGEAGSGLLDDCLVPEPGVTLDGGRLASGKCRHDDQTDGVAQNLKILPVTTGGSISLR